MNTYLGALFLLSMLHAMDVSAEVKDLRPPPLNPHPKEALRVTVSFDRPEDAKRYVIVMKALYLNQRSECGYVETGWNRRFIYPQGTFDIPNKSHNPQRAQFDIYLDRFNREACNWELAKPQIRVRDRYTGKDVIGLWGTREDLIPGTEYKATCPFRESEHSLRCFGGEERVPDTSFYNSVPASRRISITVHVSEKSAPLPPRAPSFFGNFVQPARLNE